MDAHIDYSSLNFDGPDHAACERQLRTNWLFVKEAIDDGAASKSIAQAFLAGDLNEARHAVQAAVNAHVEFIAKRGDYDWPVIAESWDQLRSEAEAPDDKTRVLQLIATHRRLPAEKVSAATVYAMADAASEVLANDIPMPRGTVGEDAE